MAIAAYHPSGDSDIDGWPANPRDEQVSHHSLGYRINNATFHRAVNDATFHRGPYQYSSEHGCEYIAPDYLRRKYLDR